MFVGQGAITRAEWRTSLGGLLDGLHARWPLAQILVARIYHADWTAEQDTMNDTDLPTVLSTRGPWAAVGIDERTFLPGNTSDSTHPNSTGYTLTAAEWQTAMGY